MPKKLISVTLILIFLCHGAALAAGPRPAYEVGWGLRPISLSERDRAIPRLVVILKPIIPEKPLQNWDATRQWLKKNKTRAEELNNAALSNATLAEALFGAGGSKQNWRWQASILDLLERIREILPKDTLRTWEATKQWLEENKAEAERLNNAALEREGEKTTTLSNKILIDALLEEGKLEQNWTWHAGILDLLERIREILPKDTLRTWEATKQWLEENKAKAEALNNAALKQEGEKATTLANRTLAQALFEAGGSKQNWAWQASILDLLERIQEILPKDTLATWKAAKQWLEENKAEAERLNNAALEQEGEEVTTLANATLVKVLLEAGKLEQNWSREASALDLAGRLKGLFDKRIPSGAMSRIGTRHWLILNRQDATRLNNRRLGREAATQVSEGEPEGQIEGPLSYASIYVAMEMDGITMGGFNLWKASAMDYVRNNWRIYVAEMSIHSKGITQDTFTDPDELYKKLSKRFTPPLFLDIRHQRKLDIIDELKGIMSTSGLSYDEAVGQLGLSQANARDLRPYVEETEQFAGKQLSPKSFGAYLKEFCQTWVDICYGTDTELQGQLRASLNIHVPAGSVITTDDLLDAEILSCI